MPFREEDLDHTPLKFGKFKGKTPEWVADNEILRDERSKSWLIWAYETCGNQDVCSSALYRELGGKGERAEPDSDWGRRNRSDLREPATDPVSGEIDFDNMGKDAQEERLKEIRQRAEQRRAPRPAHNFDDMDDDIPF